VPTPNSTFNEANIFRAAIVLFMENNVFKSINKIPGGRKISPLLCFLINIDELWFYQYHERDYGSLMNDFFDSIQGLENEKWQLLS
jgi:hypothetical protein